MRARIAEIDQHPVAHVFGDKSAEPADRIGDGVLVGHDPSAQIVCASYAQVRRSRVFGQLPGTNKLKAGSRQLVARFPEIKIHPVLLRMR